MILLLGGTSETEAAASALAQWGHGVLVSTATDLPLDCGQSAAIKRRSGRLNEWEMVRLVKEKNVRAIVDVTHPYAEQATLTASRVAENLRISYFRFERASMAFNAGEFHGACDHDRAAEMAAGFGKTIFLAIGANHVAPYVARAREKDICVFARVLPGEDSMQKCVAAGISKDRILQGRGPFSVSQNVAAIKGCGAGVMVTKESGKAGGFREKIDAAKKCGCEIVVVQRPPVFAKRVYSDIDELARAVNDSLRSAIRFKP